MATARMFQSARCPRVAHRRTAATSRAARALAVTVRSDSVLIVNAKSGGHSFVGYHLAKQLLAKGHSVTILNAGDASIEAKAPFSEYPELAKQGVTIAYGTPTDPSTYPAGDFDVVYDNNGKSMDDCKALIDTYASKVKHYVFVASAGAYAANPVEPMHVEGDVRKAKASHVAVEQYLEEVRAPFTVFHPLYIYGPLANKDCEQYFIDRIIRNRPVCIPAPGIQLTTISHVDDLASMLASVPGNNRCIEQHYNCCTDRAVTLDGIVRMLAKALDKEVKIVHYDPSKLDIPKGKGFPFRTVHFFASAEKAKRELDWKPKHRFSTDISDCVGRYLESGRQNKDMEFAVDDMIIRSLAA